MADNRAAAIPAEARAFLADMKVPAVLATVAPDGRPIASAVWYGFDGDRVIVSTPGERPKARNVRGDPRVSLIVDTKERPYRGVAIEGTAALLEDPDLRFWRAIASRYLGDTLPAEMLDRARSGPRVTIAIEPDRVRTWNLG